MARDIEMPADEGQLRRSIRSFIDNEIAKGHWQPHIDSWLTGWDARFSQALAQQGWVGMSIPTEYGGRGTTALRRYIVTEELLAAGAPVAAHWIADRQVAPALLRYGSPYLRDLLLPGIANGTVYFAIGLSEPDAGSDLASLRTNARPTAGGWTVSGTKLWTSGAHHAQYIVVLARTSNDASGKRHEGLTQLVVPLDTAGISVRPVLLLNGAHHFNEVVLDDVFVGDDMVLGSVGEGWRQVLGELAYERSGPERFLSTFPLLERAVIAIQESGLEASAASRECLGSLMAAVSTLRRMSIAIAASIDDGQAPELTAAMVKDLGTQFELEVIEQIRAIAEVHQELLEPRSQLSRLYRESLEQSPGFTLRGGTTEVLRSVVARGLGLR